MIEICHCELKQAKKLGNMNNKLQEIFNKAYWDLHKRYESLDYYDVKPFQDKRN